jgi:hypothetical protein
MINPSGNHPHPFERGPSRHRPLPKRCAKDVRIPREFVSNEWLANNPTYNAPAFLSTENAMIGAMEGIEPEVGPVDAVEGGDGAGDDAYEDTDGKLLSLELRLTYGYLGEIEYE